MLHFVKFSKTVMVQDVWDEWQPVEYVGPFASRQDAAWWLHDRLGVLIAARVDFVIDCMEKPESLTRNIWEASSEEVTE